MSGTGSPAQEFLTRLRAAAIKPLEIARFLDALSHGERVEAIRACGRSEQRRLYEAVKGVGRVSLRDLVAPERADLEPVRHYGRNTLPAFTHFEKRFCRPSGADPARPDRLYGFNFQTMSFVTGPGYFVAREDPRAPEVLIDYREVPPAAPLPAGWPAVRRNEVGLGRLVYGNMVDTLRRVSEHVTVGSAARGGKDLGSWFLLCREA
ncbi:MAG TPA: hypothetical protein VMW35_19430 [Myxococcota bacterium]|jgi:hypothetical protein|nr:hypothetical protein [Myxococcota bacterium]